MASSKKKVTNYRNAETGKFTTKEYVKKHPSTTTTEHNPEGNRGGSKKKK